MPKLLVINIASNWGSHGRLIEDIGLHLVAAGWQVKVAHGQFESPSQLETIRVGNKTSLYAHYLRSAFDAHGLGSTKATRQLVRTIEDYDPDVIHLNIIHDYYLNYLVLFDYLQRCGKPIVWTFHDCWAFTGHCAHFENENCYKWKRGCHNCINTHKYPVALIDRSRRNYRLKARAFTSVSRLTIVPVSHWLERFLPESFLRKYPVRMIYNGVDLSVFRHRLDYELLKRYGIPRDKHIILGLASRWDEKKGMTDFFELDRLLDHGHYQIVMVGIRPAQRSVLPATIIGIERTDCKEELAVLYSHASVFVNPTYEDTLPTTNIESLACGTPVVTYQTGGSPETLDTATGYVVARGDVEGLYRSVVTICGEPRASYVSVCSERARRLFSAELCCRNYEKLFNRVLGL